MAQEKNGYVSTRECEKKHTANLLWTLGIMGIMVLALWRFASAVENRLTTVEVQMRMLEKIDKKLDSLMSKGLPKP